MKQDMKRSIQWGFLFLFIQLGLVFLVAPRFQGIASIYLKLNQWDSLHYLDIIDQGYHIPAGTLVPEDVHRNRANVGYFPAYPLAVKGFLSVVPVSSPVGMLLVAQFFCFLFWTQFFLLLRLFGVSWRSCFFWGLTVFVYPASFFLVAGYSESLFMFALIGFIFWTERALQRQKGFANWGLAAICGLLLSSTRLVGIPLVIYPVLRTLLAFGIQKESKVLWVKSLLLAGISGLGGIGFFVWTYFRFGQWDLYLKLQKLGWGNEPDYLAIFYSMSYLPKLFFEDTTTSVCKVSNLFILLLFLWLFLKARQTARFWKKVDWSLFFVGFSMFFISLSGKASYNMDSMVRYNLPVFVIWIMTWINTIDSDPRKYQKAWIQLGYWIALAFQIWMIRVFTKGGWVA